MTIEAAAETGFFHVVISLAVLLFAATSIVVKAIKISSIVVKAIKN